MAKPRLFVESKIGNDPEIIVTGDAHHYLARVMRMREGDEVEVFDGVSDVRLTRILSVGKNATTLGIIGIATPHKIPPDIMLCFAPIKKARTDFIVEKATELGARFIQPIITEFTNAERVRTDRLQRHAIEAAEQCGGSFVPEVLESIKLSALLASQLPQKRKLIFCDESTLTPSKVEEASAPAAILIGPEGGFSETERASIRDAGALTLSLGPRILRADTAAIAALTLWQSRFGDWQ